MVEPKYLFMNKIGICVGLAICEYVSCERARSTQPNANNAVEKYGFGAMEQVEKKITENTLFLNYLILAFNIWIWLNLINLPAQ